MGAPMLQGPILLPLRCHIIITKQGILSQRHYESLIAGTLDIRDRWPR